MRLNTLGCIWALSAAFAPCTASAHQAPLGWAYDYACCSDKDCRPVPNAEVNEGQGGYSYRGQSIPYGDRRIRQSGDEHFHVCTVAGKPDGRVLCLYEPVRGF